MIIKGLKVVCFIICLSFIFFHFWKHDSKLQDLPVSLFMVFFLEFDMENLIPSSFSCKYFPFECTWTCWHIVLTDTVQLRSINYLLNDIFLYLIQLCNRTFQWLLEGRWCYWSTRELIELASDFWKVSGVIGLLVS
jgi:hypothetical protein